MSPEFVVRVWSVPLFRSVPSAAGDSRAAGVFNHAGKTRLVGLRRYAGADQQKSKDCCNYPELCHWFLISPGCPDPAVLTCPLSFCRFYRSDMK